MQSRFRIGVRSLVGLAVLSTGASVAVRAQAEGSGQLTQLASGASRGLLKETVMYVDVLNGDHFLQISARGTDNTLKVNVTPPGATTATVYSIDTLAHGQLDNVALPAQLPDATHTPLSVATGVVGAYKLQFSQDVEPFDVTVTQSAPTQGQPFTTTGVPTGGGRLYSKDWRFFTPLPGGTLVPNPEFFVRSAVDSSHEYLWKLDFDGLLGGYMCLTANNLGLPAPFSRTSQRYSGVQQALNNGNALDRYTLCPQLSQFPLYLNRPHDPLPAPASPVLAFNGIGACGAVLEGSGGSFAFTSNLPVTYELVIDTDKDGKFGVVPASGNTYVNNDIVLSGTAIAGLNAVAWDGKGKNGQALPASGSPYQARLFLRVGEFHFTGSDIEGVRNGSGGGIAVYQVNPTNFTETGARIYWDDSRLDNATGTPANPAVALPDGVQSPATRHSWTGTNTGGQNFDGPGENALVDTWVFGDQVFQDHTFTIYSSTADEDGDGLSNGRECTVGSRFDNVDTDADGVRDNYELSMSGPIQDTDGDNTPDVLDQDDDNDTLLTKDELPDADANGNPSDALDTNSDATPNYLDADDDGDGVPTKQELEDATQAGNDDADADGDTNWLDPDSDGDGRPDGTETAGNGDANQNGVPDYLEVDPNADSDGDGVLDSDECAPGKACPDTDGDNLTDDNDEDDDGDGVLTRDELGNNGQPMDTDGDGKPDHLDADDDDDGLLTRDELGAGKTPRDTDADGAPDYLDDDDDDDGNPTAQEVADAEALNAGKADATDVDADGLVNWLDTDSDGDETPDITENLGTGDTNKNGVPDYLEAGAAAADDADKDGLTGDSECAGAKQCPDTDGDGVSDDQDADDDGDGIPTVEELGDPANPIDTDKDGIPDYLDADDDNDGIPTAKELADALALTGLKLPRDVDGDGKKNWLDTDSDGDGLEDKAESAGNGDANANGVPDYLEAPTLSTSLDTDLDGLPDAVECATPGACPDSDKDGITDDKDADDDGDGVLTKNELKNGAPKDTDADGMPDHLDTDDDGDTLLTRDELGIGTSPRDTDADGKADYLDTDDDGDRVNTIKELDSGKARDRDKDGKPDHLDVDDDGDGRLTTDELGDVLKPRDRDGDGLPDYLDPDEPRGPSIEGGGVRCSMQPGSGSGASGSGLGGLLLVAAALGLIRRRRESNVKSSLLVEAKGLQKAAAAALLSGALLTPGTAEAQQTDVKGFALDRFDAAERGSDWFWAESLDLRGSGRFAAGLTGDWAYKPLITYDGQGNEYAAIIKDQLFVHVGASVNFADRVRVGLSLPLLLWQDGTPVALGTSRFEAKEGAALGDLRLGVDVRLLGEYTGPATLALGAQVFFPTGSRESFSGDGKVRFAPRLMLAGDVASFAYGAKLGMLVHGLRSDFAGHAFGTDVQYGAAAGLRFLDRALLIGPELFGSTVLSDDGDGLFKRQTTPFEAVLGAHYYAGAFRFGAGAGPGFTSGLGSPAVRVLASFEWFPPIEEAPPPPPPDRDGDGILDVDDACPDVPGVASDDKSKHGCPVVPPKDTDKDGFFDDEEACPFEPGVASDDKSKHGCPLPDSDGDGILDKDDACVQEPGEKNSDPAKHGCPPPKDSDADGIIDPEDACPLKAGPRDSDPAKNGCPRVQVTEERVVILDRIEFDTNRATIRPESNEILDAVYRVLQENPKLQRIRVEGHTDNRGGVAHNRDLSKRRAQAVVKWLVGKGIDAARLTSGGFGADRPIDNNETETGRQNNRRVEFHIESKSGE